MYITTKLNNWDDIHHIARLPLFIFRGQSHYNWPLETTLYRECIRLNPDKVQNIKNRERWILYQFKRFAHQYKSDLPDDRNILDWLTLIQHYGGPTRLLDFSYSLYVAAFFAIESSNTDASIWALDLAPYTIKVDSQLKIIHKPKSLINDQNQDRCDKFNEIMSDCYAFNGTIHLDPHKINERMWHQQGTFLAPVDPSIPFMESMKNTLCLTAEQIENPPFLEWNFDLIFNIMANRTECKIIKIIIPQEIHEEIRSFLKLININASTLFPGLEGFARSLKFHI